MPIKSLLNVLRSPRWPAWLLGAFVIWFGIWAINPLFPKEFIVEHVLTVAGVAFLCWSYSQFRLSNISYLLIFIFLCFHVVGAHYTYTKVPYEDWITAVASLLGAEGFRLGKAFGFERNHYDRLVHFLFGLLLAYPVREIFIRIAGARGFWGYYLPLDVTMSLSMLYELIEWAVTMVFAADVGQAYLGTQGDEWDAHKDMALATAGGAIAMLVTVSINRLFQRDFAAEMAESLRVRRKKPLGEASLAEMLRKTRKKH